MAYEKQTWHTGDVITEGKLNHMEDGIKNIYPIVVNYVESATPPQGAIIGDSIYTGYYIDNIDGMNVITNPDLVYLYELATVELPDENHSEITIPIPIGVPVRYLSTPTDFLQNIKMVEIDGENVPLCYLFSSNLLYDTAENQMQFYTPLVGDAHPVYGLIIGG